MRIVKVIIMTKITAIPETFYDDFLTLFFGSYSSSFFHIDNEIDAIFRARVTFAKWVWNGLGSWITPPPPQLSRCSVARDASRIAAAGRSGEWRVG